MIHFVGCGTYHAVHRDARHEAGARWLLQHLGDTVEERFGKVRAVQAFVHVWVAVQEQQGLWSVWRGGVQELPAVCHVWGQRLIIERGYDEQKGEEAPQHLSLDLPLTTGPCP